MDANLEARGLIVEAAAVAREAGEIFGGFTATQLNWKPGAEVWSIGQCFDHLLTTNAAYFPALEQLMRGEKRVTFWERLPLWPALLGRFIIKSLDPQATRKLKAPAALRPTCSDVSEDVIDRFVAQQERLIDFIQETAAGHDLKSTIITSPISPVITYSLRDGYRIILVHERRHLAQALRVLDERDFPHPSLPES